ncbi:MAG: hypothetical protein QM820_46330 [Minicystis sp.]
MRPRTLAAIPLTLAFSACQLVWSYDNFDDQPNTGGSAPTSSSSSDGGSSSTWSTSSSPTRATWSSSASSSSASSSSTSSSSASSSSGCTVDDDKDEFLSWKCHPADATLDCADEDDRVFPDAGFEDSPIMGEKRPGTQPWDFNCDGKITQETPVLSCGGFFFCGGSGYQKTETAPVCGMLYPLGHCAPIGWFGACQWTPENPLVMQVQRCK